MAEKSFNEFLQEFVNKPYEELLSIANDAFKAIYQYLEQMNYEEKASDFILPIIATTLAVDGKYSQLEHNFLNSVLESDISYEDGKAYMVCHYDEELFNLVDEMIDACGTEFKSAIIIFCLCFAAVDETITREECAFLAKLID